MPQHWKGGKAAAVKRYQQTHKELVNRLNRNWYSKNKEKVIAKQLKYQELNRGSVLSRQKLGIKVKRARLGMLVKKGYGGKCVCCGEMEHAFLLVHHPNGDGSADRKLKGGTFYLYQWLIDNDYPEGYELLCANCHQGIHKSEDGICPHKKEE